MEMLRSSKFIDIEFDSIKKMYKITWKSTTEDMTDEEFKEEMLAYSNFFDLGGHHVLHDMVNMNFSIVPELQEWLDKNINTKGVKAGVQNAAFILSSDIFSSVSVQQTNEELNAKKIPMQYFDDEAEAKKWLLNE